MQKFSYHFKVKKLAQIQLGDADYSDQIYALLQQSNQYT